MKCEDVRKLMFESIEESLIDNSSFEAHLISCEACKDEYLELKLMLSNIGGLREELPASFKEGLRSRLHFEVASSKKKGILSFNWKIASSVAAVFLIALIASNQLENKNFESTNDEYGGIAYSKEIYTGDAIAPTSPTTVPTQGRDASLGSLGINLDSAEDGSFTSQSVDSVNVATENIESKIIRNVSMAIEVTNYRDTTGELNRNISLYGGYVQYSSEYINQKVYDGVSNYLNLYRGSYTIRIPSASFSEFVEYSKSLGDVVSISQGDQNVTREYYDLKAKLINLESQESRIRELFTQASSIEEMIMIENELSRLRYQIDSIGSTLNSWDNLVSFSTVNLEIIEITKQTSIKPLDNDLGTRFKEQVIKSVNNIISGLENMLVKVGFALPIILIIVVMLTLVIAIYKIIRRRK